MTFLTIPLFTLVTIPPLSSYLDKDRHEGPYSSYRSKPGTYGSSPRRIVKHRLHNQQQSRKGLTGEAISMLAASLASPTLSPNLS
jgi:hypothetical protein